MRRLLTLAILTSSLTIGLAPAAEARGCIRGALVGGVAGHYVGRGHAVAGAAAGCLAGRHLANRADRRRAARPLH